jgi:hypothetical protein
MFVCKECSGEYTTEQEALDCAEYDKEEDLSEPVEEV